MVIAAVPLTSWPALAECVAIKYRDTPEMSSTNCAPNFTE
jgi:hypothetical protein